MGPGTESIEAPVIFPGGRPERSGGSYSRFARQAVKQGLTLFANPFPQFSSVAPLAEQLFGDLQRRQHRGGLRVGAPALLQLAHALVDVGGDLLDPALVLVGLQRVAKARDLHRDRLLHGLAGSIPVAAAAGETAAPPRSVTSRIRRPRASR